MLWFFCIIAYMLTLINGQNSLHCAVSLDWYAIAFCQIAHASCKNAVDIESCSINRQSALESANICSKIFYAPVSTRTEPWIFRVLHLCQICKMFYSTPYSNKCIKITVVFCTDWIQLLLVFYLNNHHRNAFLKMAYVMHLSDSMFLCCAKQVVRIHGQIWECWKLPC